MHVLDKGSLKNTCNIKSVASKHFTFVMQLCIRCLKLYLVDTSSCHVGLQATKHCTARWVAALSNVCAE